MADASPSGRNLATIAETLDRISGQLDKLTTLLEAAPTPNVCPHGGTGFCMSCVTPQLDYHLTELMRTIGNQVWEATRRA